MDSAGGPFLAGEQIMQINKQNRNMNIYGYDILIGRDADSTRGILGFLGLWIYELASILGFCFWYPCSISQSPKSPASLVTRQPRIYMK